MDSIFIGISCCVVNLKKCQSYAENPLRICDKVKQVYEENPSLVHHRMREAYHNNHSPVMPEGEKSVP